MLKKKNWMDLGTCVSPQGYFVWSLHQPHFQVCNLRQNDFILPLGQTAQGETPTNQANFPPDDIHETNADPIYEVANAFAFRGTTYIAKSWADAASKDIDRIAIAPPQNVSLEQAIQQAVGTRPDIVGQIFNHLPDPVRIALATTSTDPKDLIRLACQACRFVWDPDGHAPIGLAYATDSQGRIKPCIDHHQLYEAVANNPHLPNAYKEIMVLRPGIQGSSEIVGQWQTSDSHAFEYLRRNSYIPWGHYAANMAHDRVRYAVADLTAEDMRGLRHLYYQRTYIRLAQALNLALPIRRKTISAQTLEALRQQILAAFEQGRQTDFTATLWGWNYGFDYAPSGYRLHASHQQIHQQFALVPERVPSAHGGQNTTRPAFAYGDLIQSFMQHFQAKTGKDFFTCYLKALMTNTRLDGCKSRPADLKVYGNDQVILFVPKAQTSQWELQLMTLAPVGNIIETDQATRHAIDTGIAIAMHILTAMGATLVTVFEASKRFNLRNLNQRLLYIFLPRLPESPGAFSEAQLRWINGHYPEDFALACRLRVEEALKSVGRISAR